MKKQVFAVRFFLVMYRLLFSHQPMLLFTNPYYYDSIDNGVHFDQYLLHKDKYIHSQCACIMYPTTPRFSLAYVKEVPNLVK